MQIRWIAASLLLILGTLQVRAQDAIRLKSGRILGESAEQEEGPGGGHLLVRFRTHPGAEAQAELARRGIRTLRYVPDSALLISSDEPADLSGLDVVWAGRLRPADRISPLLRERTGNAFLVIFHADVSASRARSLAESQGFDVLPEGSMLPGQLVVTGAVASLNALAAMDEVAYILPASFDLAAGESLIGCPGPLTENGLVGEFVDVGKGWARDAGGAAWLSYVMLSFPERLSETAVRGEIERAIREWERYGNLRITQGNPANAARTIAIRFARRDHGDSYPFDGAGRVLAHTFYPAPPNAEPIAGDLHFDGDEAWSVGAYLDLFSVTLHELGHALGLGHSDQPGAVMYPYYRFTTGLSTDDIAGIRSLYGAAGSPPVQPPVTPPVTPAPPAPPGTPAQPPAQPPAADRTPPTLAITAPGASIVSTNAATIRMAGTAADNVGVTAIRWSTSNGYADAAAGTTNWTAVIPLLVGTNTVTVRASDAAGNAGWRSVMIVRR